MVPKFPFPVLNTLFLAREKCVSYCLLRKPKLKLPSRLEGCAFRLIQMTLLSVESMTFSLKSNFPVENQTPNSPAAEFSKVGFYLWIIPPYKDGFFLKLN